MLDTCHAIPLGALMRSGIVKFGWCSTMITVGGPHASVEFRVELASCIWAMRTVIGGNSVAFEPAET